MTNPYEDRDKWGPGTAEDLERLRTMSLKTLLLMKETATANWWKEAVDDEITRRATEDTKDS